MREGRDRGCDRVQGRVADVRRLETALVIDELTTAAERALDDGAHEFEGASFILCRGRSGLALCAALVVLVERLDLVVVLLEYDAVSGERFCVELEGLVDTSDQNHPRF